MIQSLLSRFETYPVQFCKISETGRNNLNASSNLGFYYANKVFMILTLAWLGFVMFSYSSISLRPQEVFEPSHITGRLIMPSFPSPFLFYGVGFLAAIVTLIILFVKGSILLRGLLFICTLWLSLLQWSYGNQSAINNTFLLSHLLAVFIPFKSIYENRYDTNIYKSIQWFYFGILFTYTLSGTWKWFGLVYKLLFKPNEVSWLSPVGALYNALTGYHSADYPLEGIYKFYAFPLFWQISFLLMTFILTFGFIAAFRQPLRIWAGVSFIIFHLVNSIAFDVWSYWFHPAILTLIVLFFPYELFIIEVKNHKSRIIKKDFTGYGLTAKYIRNYENGDCDIFYSYYAYREKTVDRNFLLGGILYTPFLSTIVELYWKLVTKVKNVLIEVKS